MKKRRKKVSRLQSGYDKWFFKFLESTLADPTKPVDYFEIYMAGWLAHEKVLKENIAPLIHKLGYKRGVQSVTDKRVYRALERGPGHGSIGSPKK